MRIVFMGTPDFSVPILQALAAQHEIVAVYSQPPRPAGRGKADRKSPVQQCAETLGLPVRHPVSLRTQSAAEDIAQLQCDVAVVVAYGLILPPSILQAPKRGCLNIHASLLPRWRGAAPIHRAILAGDAETGICIMQMDEGLDTGAVLQRQATPIRAEETTADLHDRLSTMGAGLILQALDRLPDLPLQPQSAEGVTYAAKIDKAEARIDWTLPAEQVDRQIRGLSPFPGAWTMVGDERLKLLRSRLAQGAGAAGQVLHGMTIACGSGAVEITEAQREGKRPSSATDLLRGFALPALLS
jgi:methionyl-tRNA formyltransferase